MVYRTARSVKPAPREARPPAVAVARGRGWSRTQVLRADRRRTWRVGARASGVARLCRGRRPGARRGAGVRPEPWLDLLAHELRARGVARLAHAAATIALCAAITVAWTPRRAPAAHRARRVRPA